MPSRTKKTALSAVFALFLSCSTVSAQTLDAAVSYALQNHPSIDAAKASSDIAREERSEARSGYFPDLSVTATGGRIFGDNSTSRGLSVTRGDGYSYLWEGSVTANQMIFDGFETSNRIDAANLQKKSADMSIVDSRENLSLRAVQAFIDVKRTREALLLLKKHEAKVADYLQRIKVSVDEGISDEAEHQQARDVRVILDGFIADYEGQLRTAESNYQEVIGMFPEAGLLKPNPDMESLPDDVQQALDLIRSDHPAVNAAKLRAKAAYYGVDAEEAQLYPDLDGELSYYKSDKDDIIGGEAIDARAVLRMNWNFETGGAQLSRIKKKKFEHKQAIAEYQRLVREVERGVRLSYADLETSQRKRKNAQERKSLNTKLFSAFSTQFEGSRISLLQLMQADNQLFNTKLEALNAEYRYMNSAYTALASVGRLQDSLHLASAQ